MFDLWKKTLSNVYQLNGFNPLEVPVFVRKEFLHAKGGINNEIYAVSRLQGEDGDDKTNFGIAFDRTVPFALWVRDHQRELTFPYKRYDISLSYRGENPSPGRFRGFYQCDIDVVGPNLGINNDVQCISALVEGLSSLLDSGLHNEDKRGFKMYLNEIKVPKALFNQAGVPDDKMPQALAIVDKLEKVGTEEVAKLLEALLQEEVSSEAIVQLVQVLAYKGSVDEFPIPEDFPDEAKVALDDLKKIINNLGANGIPGDVLQFCPGMVRGLNYYTGVVFETFLDALPSAGSVMSGGRYDNLVDTFTANAKGKMRKTGIEGVGGSIGLTRLFDVLSRAKLITPQQKSACKVMVLAKDNLPVIPWQIAKALRNESIPCDVYTGNSANIKKQLTYANKSGVPLTVMVMDKETYCVKNLTLEEGDSNKQSEDLSTIEDTVTKVKQFLDNM